MLEVDDSCDVMRIEAKLPWPLSNRVMISTKYHIECPAESGDVCLLMSADGNEEFDAKYFSEADKKNLVLARTLVSGWWLRPIKDASGKITGTNILYINSSNAGGNIPAMIAEKKGPSLCYEAIDGVMKLVRANKK